MTVSEESQLLRQRRQKAKDLREAGIEIYANDFRVRDCLADIERQYGDWSDEALSQVKKVYICAGRIMSMRSFGRATFMHIKDGTGKLQIYVKRDEIGQESYRIFKKLDIVTLWVSKVPLSALVLVS